MNHESTPEVSTGAALHAGTSIEHGAKITHHYDVVCRDKDGNIKWEDSFDNLVTTVGKNKYLDATLKTGLAAPLWYVGLASGGTTYAAADTMASHAGWTTDTNYSNATNPAWTPGAVAAGSVDNSASAAVFTINATATINGCFLSDNNVKGAATGILLGVGTFTAGARSVLSGDTLTVTVTATMA